ncbi:hypothetical protein ACFE04_015614 [Oxalis oulophora]
MVAELNGGDNGGYNGGVHNFDDKVSPPQQLSPNTTTTTTTESSTVTVNNKNDVVLQSTCSSELIVTIKEEEEEEELIDHRVVSGFRKIDSDRWEFANEGFQGGKKHLLKSIKRKSRYNKQQQQQQQQQTKNGLVTCIDAFNSKPELDIEIENLKDDQNTLKMEISKLRQEQEDSEIQLGAVETRLYHAECKQQQMFSFLVRVAGNPNLVHNLMMKKNKNRVEIQGNKKRRLLQADSSRIAVKKQLAAMQSELNDILQDPIDSICSMHDIFSDPMEDQLCNSLHDREPETLAEDLAFDFPLVPENEYPEMSEDLIMDSDLIVDDDDEEFDVNESKNYFELKDMNLKACSWIGFMNESVEQIGCIGTLP